MVAFVPSHEFDFVYAGASVITLPYFFGKFFIGDGFEFFFEHFAHFFDEGDAVFEREEAFFFFEDGIRAPEVALVVFFGEHVGFDAEPVEGAFAAGGEVANNPVDAIAAKWGLDEAFFVCDAFEFFVDDVEVAFEDAVEVFSVDHAFLPWRISWFVCFYILPQISEKKVSEYEFSQFFWDL